MKTELQATALTTIAIASVWVPHGLAMSNIIGNGGAFQAVTLFAALAGTAACLGSHVALCRTLRNRKPKA